MDAGFRVHEHGRSLHLHGLGVYFGQGHVHRIQELKIVGFKLAIFHIQQVCFGNLEVTKSLNRNGFELGAENIEHQNAFLRIVEI